MNLKEVKRIAQPIFDQFEITKNEINFLAGKPPVLEVKIMKRDGSMDLDSCVQVSQLLSQALDEIDDGESNYNLDVCSFGAERELDSDEEIALAIGDNVHIDYKNPKDGLDQVEGELLSFENNILTVKYNAKGRMKTAAVDKENIRKIRLAVKFSEGV